MKDRILALKRVESEAEDQIKELSSGRVLPDKDKMIDACRLIIRQAKIQRMQMELDNATDFTKHYNQ